MGYPLPGETVTKTLRNVEFGRGRPRDEPAPPEIAAVFREMQEAFAEQGSAYQQWQADRNFVTYHEYNLAGLHYGSLYADLLRMLRRHRDRCFTCDGMRFWHHTESHGCRVNVIRIEIEEV